MLAMSLTRAAWGLDGAVLLDSPRDFSRVCTDSRAVSKGDLFVALRGERTDGHNYLAQALAAGAAALAVERVPGWLIGEARRRKAGLVLVADSLRALQRLALDQRSQFQGVAAAVTGSNGKTTTKDMLKRVLSLRGPVLATQGNLNNHIGLPLTLLGLDRGHRAMALEMGMNHPGELAALAAIGRPDLGVVTNVGHAHMEFFKTRDAVARAKAELVLALPSDGGVALNADDPRVAAMAALRPRLRAITYGRLAGAGLRALAVRDRGAAGLEARVALDFEGRREAATLSLGKGGKPMLDAALAALACGALAGLPLRPAAAALRGFAGEGKWRLQAEPLPGGAHALLDCYNASPESVDAALGFLALTAPRGRRVAALGDMLELGAEAPALHQAMGLAARRAGVRALAALGPHAADTCRGFGLGSAAFAEGDHAGAAAWLASRLGRGDWLLVKGSRGMRMERVHEALKER